MVHNFFRKNRKKAVISTVILSIFALSVCVVSIYNSKILAGVFQSHKNQDGTVSFVEKNKIEILEIVAQNGQQVLGYTVEGYEPIKPAQIESFTGVIDHDEFLNATGYDVSGTPGNYTVNSSHNGTFNENVLEGMMYSENDIIEVRVVTASSLSEDDISRADLIYINSADNDDNLLYYYDQIVNNGRDGIVKGDKGNTFTGSTQEEISVKEKAVSKICKSAGRLTNAEELTKEDFEKAEVENFKDYNLSEYINGIAGLQRDSFDGNSISESISKISAALNTFNTTAKDNALGVIRSFSLTGSIADEDREKMIIALKQKEYENFFEVNAEAYVDKIIAGKLSTDKKINTALRQVNKSKYDSAINELKQLKTKLNEEDFTDEKYLNIVAEVSQYFAEAFYNSEEYNKLNGKAYAEKYINDEFEYNTGVTSQFQSELKENIITVVNAEEKVNALVSIAALAHNKEETDNWKNNNIDGADVLFKLSELEEYKSYNLAIYLDAIGDLADEKDLMSNQELEDGTWELKYSEEKINILLNSVNDSKQTIEVPCDISWKMAMKLYEYVTVNGRAFTYNTELLTNKTIGDYTDPNGENNSNNMYKFLMVLRQMTPDYFRNTVLPKIDDDGNYDDGTGSGLNGRWYAGTFCSAWNNESAADKHNFCEPAVVGKLYSTEGNEIGNVTYIKDNIFSFTGGQYFGGKRFYLDTEDYKENAASASVNKEYEEVTEEVTAVFNKDNNMFSVEIPSTTKEMYYYLDNSSFGWGVLDRTYSFNVSDCPSGTVIKLVSPAAKSDGKNNFFNVKIIKPDESSTYPDSADKKIIYVDTSAVSYWREKGEGNNYANFTYLKEKEVSEGSFTTVNKEYEDATEVVTAAFNRDKNMFSVEIPSTTNEMYYYLDNSSFGWGVLDRTYSFNVSDCPSGTVIKLISPAAKSDGKTNFFNVEIIKPDEPSKYPDSADKKIIYVDTSAVSYWRQMGEGNNYANCTYLKETEVSVSVTKSKGDVLREIMGISLNQLQSMPLKVLEIQPDGNVNEFNSYEGAKRLADYLRVDLPDMNKSNYKKYFDVESISIREFGTRHEELNGTYDLIYFGTKTKYMTTKSYDKAGHDTLYRTDYGMSTVMGESYFMNGLVYTGIGQQREVGGSLRGTVAGDYYTVNWLNDYVRSEHNLWTKYFFAEFSEPGNNYLQSSDYYLQRTENVKTRLSGNDLTVARMNDLLEYVKAGYPILFADGLLNSDEDFVNATTIGDSANYDSAIKWKYLDNNSKLYAFIQQAKALGKDSNGEYTDVSELYDGKPYASLVSVKYAKYGKNPDKLTAAEKFNGGLGFAVKRNVQVDFEYIKGPQEYDRDTAGNIISIGNPGTYVTDSNSCVCILKPNIARDNVMEWINDNYKFRFLIDKSGTANFPENQTVELDMYTYFDEKNNEITVSSRNGKWPTGLEGFIPWKLEAVNKNNEGNRWTYVGYSAFKKKKPDVVNVLWVKAESSGNGAVNGTTLDFKAMMDKYDGHNGGKDYIPEYEIRVDTINYKAFVNNWSNIPQEEKDNPYDKSRSRIRVGRLQNTYNNQTINDGSDPEYHMIVIGYCDSYDGLDIDNIYCLNNIDYFVNKAGRSMLFAHDNASAITSFNYYTDSNGGNSIKLGEKENYWSHNLVMNYARYTTSYMRGLLGMDAYGSTYSPLAFNSANETTDKQYLSWLYKYTPSVYNARSYITDNPANPEDTELSDMRGFVDGQVLWYSTSKDNWPIKTESGNDIGDIKYGDWVNTKGIECTNKGQIAIYPFVIGDELTVDSETHFQYTRLDVENNDTTVWYTLANSGNSPYYDATKGDGSNNYYIYSNGNITYTGAGHRYIKDDAKECLLFVNTVVAAIKLGNFAPDVTYPEAVSVNNTEVLYGYDTDELLKVTFKATDYDARAKEDGNFLDAIIFLDKNKDGVYNAEDGDILLNTPESMAGTGGTYLKNADETDMIIRGPELENRVDKTFYLKFEDLANIYDNLPGNKIISDKTSAKVEALFADTSDSNDNNKGYRICVSVLSKLEKERFDKESAANIKDYYQSESARVILRTLYDLK